MYSRDKIIDVMCRIKKGSEGIQPYVTICQPRRDLNEVPAQNFDGYENLHIDMLGYSHGFCNIGGEKVDVARNYLFERALESGSKYMFFIGEDTVVPYDAFIKLHETAEKNPNSMVVGPYYIKLSSSMVMVRNGNWITPANVDPGQDPFKVWMCGLDCALIPIDIVRQMKDADPEVPFCAIGYNIKDPNTGDNLPFIGEDNFFIHRMHEMGFNILCNTNVQCLHVDILEKIWWAHPSITDEIVKSKYITNFPLIRKMTWADKSLIDRHWVDRLPSGTGAKTDKENE
jgi:hypothetical protein